MLTQSDKIIIEYLVSKRDWATRKEIAKAFETSWYSDHPSTVAKRIKKCCHKVGYGIVIRRKRIPYNMPVYKYRVHVPNLIKSGYIERLTPVGDCFQFVPQ